MSIKLAEINIEGNGEVVAIRYADDAPNDAPDLTGFMKNLVPALVEHLGFAHKPMIYLDSHGVWDEVVLNAGEFAGFRTLGYLKDREAAVKRVMFLHTAMRMANNHEGLGDALALLRIFKDANGNPTPSNAEGTATSTEELLARLGTGLAVAAMTKLNRSHDEVLRKVLASFPDDRREEVFEVLDRVRREWRANHVEQAILVRDLAKSAVATGQRTREAKAAQEQAKGEVKH